MESAIECPRDSLGFHLQMSEALFGKDSVPSRFLQKQINELPLGKMTKYIGHESQLVILLANMKNEELKAEELRQSEANIESK